MADEPRRPEKSLDAHHEALFGTDMNPDTGLVTIVAALVKTVGWLGPVIQIVKGAKWGIVLVITGLLGAFSGEIASWLRGIFGGGQ